MHTDIRCGNCGYVPRFLTAELELHHNPDDGFALYVGSCPLCLDLVGGADPDIVGRLIIDGVTTRRLRPTPRTDPQEPERIR